MCCVCVNRKGLLTCSAIVLYLEFNRNWHTLYLLLTYEFGCAVCKQRWYTSPLSVFTVFCWRSLASPPIEHCVENVFRFNCCVAYSESYGENIYRAIDCSAHSRPEGKYLILNAAHSERHKASGRSGFRLHIGEQTAYSIRSSGDEWRRQTLYLLVRVGALRPSSIAIHNDKWLSPLQYAFIIIHSTAFRIFCKFSMQAFNNRLHWQLSNNDETFHC